MERFDAANPGSLREAPDRNGERVAAGNGTQRDRDLTATGTLPVASRRTTEGRWPIDKPSRATRPSAQSLRTRIEGMMRRAHPPRIGLPVGV